MLKSFQKCHAPLFKIRWSGDATRVGDDKRMRDRLGIGLRSEGEEEEGIYMGNSGLGLGKMKKE